MTVTPNSTPAADIIPARTVGQARAPSMHRRLDIFTQQYGPAGGWSSGVGMFGPTYYDNVNSGGRYDPTTNTWSATSTLNAPEGRWFHTAVWTGSEMIVWGGNTGFSRFLNTGGRYNPSTNSWSASIALVSAPTRRDSQSCDLRTGSEMIVWGGSAGNNDTRIREADTPQVRTVGHLLPWANAPRGTMEAQRRSGPAPK